MDSARDNRARQTHAAPATVPAYTAGQRLLRPANDNNVPLARRLRGVLTWFAVLGLGLAVAAALAGF